MIKRSFFTTEEKLLKLYNVSIKKKNYENISIEKENLKVMND